jgi:hypothetical protein
MNKLHFAKLVAFIASQSGQAMDDWVLEQLSQLTTMPPVASKIVCDVDALYQMMEAMQQGRKIDAIKAHQALTGYGLKESKDAVEKYWFDRGGIEGAI